MFDTRRRRLAWLFALVLLAELALLCCASIHVNHHICHGDDCAICACVRTGMKRAMILALPALASLAVAVRMRARRARRVFAGIDSLIARRVQLND